MKSDERMLEILLLGQDFHSVLLESAHLQRTDSEAFITLLYVTVHGKGSLFNQSLWFRAQDKGHYRESSLLLVLIAEMNLLDFLAVSKYLGLCLLPLVFSSLLLPSLSRSIGFCPTTLSVSSPILQ